MSDTNGFINCIRRHRRYRSWSRAELARRAGLSQPEVSRLEGGVRTPTLRHVQGLAEAFSATIGKQPEGPTDYNEWTALLVDLGQLARKANRQSRRSA